ncbi:MAG: bifunctional UDP-N-acetylglucosamine diphosphorylase/glucosamine-1-phosphate N-acetyltransferase GlmU [Oligoflexia bacterium]|jgi:bifunctional UDP-N-acetylglucosamine pyrophosphorylase/glucosamine-1-phosphate N-acetyltransferase
MPHYRETSVGEVAVIILAAGLGRRMKSALPKVLHKVSGRPMVLHILDAVMAARPKAKIAVVVGHGSEQVEQAVRLSGLVPDEQLTFVAQPEQKGTGHAARCAMDSDWGVEVARKKIPVLVLPGDLPLVGVDLVTQMCDSLSRGSLMRLLTTELRDPTGYGRVLRRGKAGAVLRVIEERDAKPREKLICEVATSIYFFQGAFLKAALSRLSNKNSQAEYYLTDVVEQAARAAKGAGHGIEVLKWSSPGDLRGVNDPWELAEASEILNSKVIRALALSGVRFDAPKATWIESTVQVAPGVEIQTGVVLRGKTVIHEGAVIKAGSVIEDSVIGAHASIGPYAHLRPGSEVGEGTKIGNFVELKKARIGSQTSIAHLSYLGDAQVGSRVNIGCGFVTCNYDGKSKHLTRIEDEVFVGSDCQAVAPVTIGRGAYVAAGSTITQDVESEALAVARSRQVNKAGYARRFKGSH